MRRMRRISILMELDSLDRLDGDWRACWARVAPGADGTTLLDIQATPPPGAPPAPPTIPHVACCARPLAAECTCIAGCLCPCPQCNCKP